MCSPGLRCLWAEAGGGGLCSLPLRRDSVCLTAKTALWQSRQIFQCLSYQETTRKGKWEDYLGSTSAVFTVHPWKWNWGKAELQSRTGCLVHDILPCPRGPFHSFSFKYLSMDASGCDPPSFCGGWVRKRAFGSTGSFTWSCADGFASAAPG